MNTRFLCALVCAAALAACGGNGGSDPVATTPPPEPPPQTPDPEPDPEPEPSVDDHLSRLLGSSTMVIDASTISGDIWETTVQSKPASLALSDLASWGVRNVWERRADRNAVSLAVRRTDTPAAAGRTESRFDYGGWMDRSFFVVSAFNRVSDHGPLDPPSESVFARVHSLGAASGSNPMSGSATWRGAVAGVDVGSTSTAGNLIEGNAAVSVDFASPAVDVSFTNLVDATAGGSRGSMSWSGLPLTNGQFDHNGDLFAGVAFGDRGDAFNSLTGQFYGPNHEEVGGVFIRDEITGAFGAKRQ